MNPPIRNAFLGAMATSVVLFTLQGGTTVGPDYKAPVIELPDAWS